MSFLLSGSGILSSSSCFHRIFWGSLLFLGLLFLLRFRLWLRFSLPFCTRFFRMLRSGLILAVLLCVFLRAVATAGFSSLPPCFPPAMVTAVPSCLPQIFCLLRLWLLIPVFIPVFHILHLWLLLRFGSLHVVLRAASSPFAVPRLSGCCFPCVSARFLSQGFHRLISLSLLWSSGCILSLGVCSSSCLSVVFFAPASVLPPPVYLACLVWHYGSLVLLTHSDLRLPSRRGLPLGQVRVATASVFSVSECLPVMVSFLFLSPLRSSALFTSGVLFVTC